MGVSPRGSLINLNEKELNIMLFEVAIIQHPRKKKGKESLLVPPTCVLAKTEEQAYTNVLLDNADKLAKIDRDYMEILIRPFV